MTTDSTAVNFPTGTKFYNIDTGISSRIIRIADLQPVIYQDCDIPKREEKACKKSSFWYVFHCLCWGVLVMLYGFLLGVIIADLFTLIFGLSER
jgi:hypothetical protein